MEYLSRSAAEVDYYEVGYGAGLQQPQVQVGRHQREQAVPGPVGVPEVEPTHEVIGLAPRVPAPYARVAVLVPANEVPEGVARERVSREQHDVQEPQQGADADLEPLRPEQGPKGLVPEERHHDDRGVQKVPVHVVQDEERPLSPVPFRRALSSPEAVLCLSPRLARRRIEEERPVVCLPVVVAGRPETERYPQYQHRRRHEPRRPVRQRNLGRIERGYKLLVLARKYGDDDE